MMQDSARSINNFVKISINSPLEPFFKALNNSSKYVMINSGQGKKIYRPPNVIALHKQQYIDAKKVFELEIEGNAMSSYIIKIVIDEDGMFGFCFCNDFYYRKRVCKHLISGMLFLEHNNLI